jgi:hypothetical protein
MKQRCSDEAGRAGLAALDREVEEMWAALVEWADDAVPPAHWRPDIALMANDTVRRIAWLVERDRGAATCWAIFTQHVLARDVSPESSRVERRGAPRWRLVPRSVSRPWRNA